METAKFRVDPEQARALRSKLSLQDKTVLLYAGKFGHWYKLTEMVGFFSEARGIFPRLHFLILTQNDHGEVRREFARQGLPENTYSLLTLPADETPLYFACADAAVTFRQPSFSTQACSPTKVGEYLAAGLPIVGNTGIGDCDALFDGQGVSVLVSEFTKESYLAVAKELELLLSSKNQTRERCRQLADRSLSLQKIGAPRYAEVYEFLERIKK